MAVDLFAESPSLNTSPRISFSSDLSPNQTQNTDQTTDLQDFTFHSQPTDPDFHFSFSAAAAINDPSPADELFTGGLIRPLQQQPITLFPPTTTHHRSIPNKSIETEDDPETDQPIKPTTIKSIWGIKRSSSLHFEESSHKKSSSFWSLPLLARSNSTGSKETQKQRQKEIRNCSSSSSSSSSNSSFSMYNFSQKPPLKKNYGNGVRIINPVLNVPGTFGFNSLFLNNNGKERKNKK